MGAGRSSGSLHLKQAGKEMEPSGTKGDAFRLEDSSAYLYLGTCAGVEGAGTSGRCVLLGKRHVQYYRVCLLRAVVD